MQLRGHNLLGRVNRLARTFVIPEPPPVVELIFGGEEEPSFGLTLYPDGTRLNYPASYPHLNPALRDEVAPEEPQPEEPPAPEPKPKRTPPRPPVGDPVLYHHLTKFERLKTDPPLWETWSKTALVREGPPMIDNRGYYSPPGPEPPWTIQPRSP